MGWVRTVRQTLTRNPVFSRRGCSFSPAFDNLLGHVRLWCWSVVHVHRVAGSQRYTCTHSVLADWQLYYQRLGFALSTCLFGAMLDVDRRLNATLPSEDFCGLNPNTRDVESILITRKKLVFREGQCRIACVCERQSEAVVFSRVEDGMVPLDDGDVPVSPAHALANNVDGRGQRGLYYRTRAARRRSRRQRSQSGRHLSDKYSFPWPDTRAIAACPRTQHNIWRSTEEIDSVKIRSGDYPFETVASNKTAGERASDQ